MGILKRGLTALGVGAVAALTGGAAAAYLGLKVVKSAVIGGVAGALHVLTARSAPVGSSRSQVVLREKLGPAQWVVGRARTAGRIAYSEIRGSTLHLALLLSEGECDGLESIILDDKEIGLAVDGNGYRAAAAINGVLDSSTPVVKITPYFGADGNGGASLRAVSARGWTESDRLTGKAWAHVELNQWVGGRSVFERMPKIEVVMRGLKLTWPGQPTPTWTESTAAIRWWWETERKGVPTDEIDLYSVIEAHGLCTDILEYELPPEMRSTYGIDGGAIARSMRYAAGGVIFSDDRPQSVDQQFDLAWSGSVVMDGGVRRFLPGGSRKSVRQIGGDDIAEFLGRVRGVSPALGMTAIRMSLAQSTYHHFAPLSMPPHVAGMPPGSLPYRELDAGTAALINSPLQAGRTQGWLLNRARGDERWQYRLLPGGNMENLQYRLGEVCTVFDDKNGINGDAMVVESVDVQEDWTVVLSLSPQLDWTPVWVAPPLPDGSISSGGTGQPDPSLPEGALTLEEGI